METESEKGEEPQGSIVACRRPEAKRSSHEQAETAVKRGGGPNPSLLKKAGMTCGLERKTKQACK